MQGMFFYLLFFYLTLLYNYSIVQRSLIITTIFPPRKDVYTFAKKIKDFQFIAVGDKKTPTNWHVDGVTYIDPSQHNKLFPKISKVLPWNIYARKNIGYLYAIQSGSQLIAETDDDVTPYNNFPPDITKKKKLPVLSGQKFLNIYTLFGGTNTWPRGFPLDLIHQKETIKKKTKVVNAFIQNSVIDQDSDFDAIYRLTSDKPVKFKRSGEYALEKGTYCPLNSQNTFFHKEAFMLLYIPSFVNPRVEDILRGYIAQRILWELNGNLVFTYTTTFTADRNAHDYMKDFKSELPLYLYKKTD